MIGTLTATYIGWTIGHLIDMRMKNKRKLRLNDEKDPEFRGGDLKVPPIYSQRLFQDSAIKFSILCAVGYNIWLEHDAVILATILNASPASRYPLLAAQKAAVEKARENIGPESLEVLMIDPKVPTIVKVELFKQRVREILKLDSVLKRRKSLLALLALLLFLARTNVPLFSLLITLIRELLAEGKIPESPELNEILAKSSGILNARGLTKKVIKRVARKGIKIAQFIIRRLPRS
jgi:hypothetical protein